MRGDTHVMSAITIDSADALVLQSADDSAAHLPKGGTFVDGTPAPAGWGTTVHMADVRPTGDGTWTYHTPSAPLVPDGIVPWAMSMAFASRVRDQLHAADLRLVINTTASPWFMTDADSDLMLAACDGISLELALNVNCMALGSRLDAEIARYRQWLAAGKLVLLIPRGDIGSGEYAEIARWIAAFAQIIREPGQSLFVTSPSYVAPPDWSAWPAQFGAPTGLYTVTHDGPTHSRYSRAFAHGTLTVEHTGTTVEVSTLWG